MIRRVAVVLGIVVCMGLLLSRYIHAQVAAEAKPGRGARIPQQATVSAEEAIARLEAGNRRCVSGESNHEHNLANWRERFLVKQRPFATILACSDSRVPPELLFDQGFGDLFVIRVAGNSAGEDVIASVQYAIEHLDNKLIVVTGHQNCGAVSAAVAGGDAADQEPPELRTLLGRIRRDIARASEAALRDRDVAEAVKANVRAAVKQLREVPLIAEAIASREVKVVGAIYSIETGGVSVVEE